MLSKQDSNELDRGLTLMRKNLLSTDINELLIVNRYEQFSVDLVDAKTKNLIVGLPDKVVKDKVYDKERLQVICDRLHNLGYLNKANIKSVLNNNVIDSALKTAIENFQLDANLKIDGWIGDKTWLALQQLVTFEEPTKIHLWLNKSGQVNNALKRATQLRLYSLGLGDKPKLSPTAPALTLIKFRKVALTLFNGVEELNERQLLALLFDQDRMIQNLSLFSGNIHAPECRLEQQFIIAITKIELWLYGAESILPDANLIEQHKKYRAGPRRRRKRVNVQLNVIEESSLKINTSSFFYKALNSTWNKLLDKRVSEIKNKSSMYITTFPTFFKLLNELDEVDDRNLIQSLDAYVKKNKKNIKTIWKRAKNFASKLFDGIKRIGRMIKRFLGRVVDVTVEWLARPFYNLIVGIYKTLNTSIESTKEALSFLFSRYLKFKNNNAALAIKHNDADMNLFIDDQNASDVIDFSQKLLLLSKKLKAATKLISTFLTLLKSAFSALTGGWWAFFTACVNLYKDFPELINAITVLNEGNIIQLEQ
jgi:hypothetical protein